MNRSGTPGARGRSTTTSIRAASSRRCRRRPGREGRGASRAPRCTAGCGSPSGGRQPSEVVDELGEACGGVEEQGAASAAWEMPNPCGTLRDRRARVPGPACQVWSPQRTVDCPSMTKKPRLRQGAHAAAAGTRWSTMSRSSVAITRAVARAASAAVWWWWPASGRRYGGWCLPPQPQPPGLCAYCYFFAYGVGRR